MRSQTPTAFHIKTGTVGQIKNLSHTWYEWAARETCIVRDEPWISEFIRDGVRAGLVVPDRGSSTFFVDEPSFFSYFKKREHVILRTWARHLGQYEPSRRQIVRALTQLTSALSQSRGVISKRFQVAMRSLRLWLPYVNGAWAVIFQTEPIIARAFPDDLEIIFALDRPITFLRLQQDLFRFPLREVLRRYWWLNVYSPFDKPYSLADLRRMKAETKPKEIEKVFLNIERSRRDFPRFLLTVHDPRLRRRVVMAHTYSFLKTDRIDMWRWIMANLAPFYTWFAEQNKISLREASECYLGEVDAYLQQGVQPDRKQLELRVRGHWVTGYSAGSITTLAGKTAVASITRSLEKSVSSEIRGTPASRGRASGYARIILSPRDLSNVQPGDVFIARFTYPTYTPAIQKCAAVVADDGGLTSHAAVVAREFRIPCVVGTGQATRVFHNGDKVEVDATKGIVRKI